MLSKEELEQVAKEFGLVRAVPPDHIQISDGVVSVYQNVWWKGANGPCIVSLGDSNHLQNAKVYPDVYSIEKPTVWCSYSKPSNSIWALG